MLPSFAFRWSMIPKSMPLDLIRGWKPVFGKDHAPAKNLDLEPIQLKWIKSSAQFS